MSALGERLEREVRERAGRASQQAAIRMEVTLKQLWQPHASPGGATMGTISVRLESVTANSLTYVAKVETPQAKWVNDGTPAHVITPKANPGAVSGSKWPSFLRGEPLLVFDWPKGGMHPARFRWVDHPGYRGSGWWDLGIAQWHDLLADAFA